MVFSHVHTFGRDNDIHIDFVDGYTDHVHALVSLEPTQCIADVTKLLKAESSRWLKDKQLAPSYFARQTDHYVASVSPSLAGRTRQYIKNQETHYESHSFAEKHDGLLIKWGLIKV